jgi:DNA polymerase-3 subunit alpha
MNQIKKLENYLKEQLLSFKITGDILTIDNKDFYIVSDDTNVFEVNLPEEYEEQVEEYVYEFCGRWYTQKFGEEPSLSELKYKGEAVQKLPIKSFLGIHSGYELMNGVGLYKEWVKKAKFLGIETLGICEKHSLSGAFAFQQECQKNGLKSIIGMQVDVKVNSNQKICTVKLYCKDFQGWLNLLKLNTILNVDGKTYIEEDFFNKNTDGLIIIIDPKTTDYNASLEVADYYQLDTVKFINENRDDEYIDNLEKFIMNDILLQPISICDAYYLEQRDFETREVLWDINKGYDDKTDNQYFKNRDQYAKELISMFENGNESWKKLFKLAIANEKTVVEECNFVYDTNSRHLPKYKMTEEQSKQFETSEQLFMHLIKKGFKDKGIKEQKYIDRLKVEIDVLRKGDVIDYFLSLYDIIQFSRRVDMLTGLARGSAAGSLVAYLLDLIKIDPLDFDLLFERFLNIGRMGEWVDAPLYSLEMEDGSVVEIMEGTLIRLIRDGKEMIVPIDEVQESDEILKY